MNDLRYYSVYSTTCGRIALRWSPPFTTPQEADVDLREQIESGNATMGFVVRVQGTRDKKIMLSHTQPKAARKAVDRYLDLLASLAD